MPWVALLAALLGFALGVGCGVAVGRHQAGHAPPRIRYYGRRLLTGSEARQRLFGGD